ncbi:BT4734/BF3469 family protein [Fibrisoma montanum]|nr:BT4734/BF3469 family protein [Fibrisoma montanum]
MQNVLDVKVSWFERDSAPDKPRGPVKLSYWVTRRSAQLEALVDRIRSTADEGERKTLKRSLIGFTPHGTFRHRSGKGFVQHSGIICLDIDGKDNAHLGDFDQLKSYLSQIKEVAYCGLSVSGKGYFVLIPIAYPEQHEKQFDALVWAFAQMNIKVDTSGRNLDRFRYYSYDPDAYINSQAQRFTGLTKPPVKAVRPVPTYSINTDKGVLLERLANMVRNAADGQKHHELLKAARLAGGLVAGGQLAEDEAAEVLNQEIANRPDVRDVQAAYKTIRDGITYGLSDPIYAEERPAQSDQSLPQPIHYFPSFEILTVQMVDQYPAEWDEPGQPTCQLVSSPRREAFARLLGVRVEDLDLTTFTQPAL